MSLSNSTPYPVCSIWAGHKTQLPRLAIQNIFGNNQQGQQQPHQQGQPQAGNAFGGLFWVNLRKPIRH